MINNLEELKIFIQTQKEMLLTNDLTMAEILAKIVDYTNELITRIKQLNTMLTNFMTTTDTDLDNMQKQITTKIAEIDKLYSDFTTDINAQITKFKQDTLNDYTTTTTSLEKRLNDFITTSNASFNDYKTEINGIITQKTNDVDTALTNLNANIDSSVTTKLNNMVTDGTFDTMLKSAYGSYFYLSFVGNKADFPTNWYPYSYTYMYASDEDKLYFGAIGGESTQTLKVIPVVDKSLYFYNNKIYLPVLVNSILVLRQNGVA